MDHLRKGEVVLAGDIFEVNLNFGVTLHVF